MKYVFHHVVAAALASLSSGVAVAQGESAAPGGAATQPSAAVARAAADVVLADFAHGWPTGLEAVAGRVGVEGDGKSAALRVRPTEGVPPTLPPGVVLPIEPRDWNETSAVAVRLRASPGGGQQLVRVRLVASDVRGMPILQHSHLLAADQSWHDVAVPLWQFRWADRAAGWNEVRALRVAIETPFGEMSIDDIRLVAADGPKPTPGERLARFAFAGRAVRIARADGVMLATDVGVALSDDDLRVILGDMVRARQCVRRLFADALNPVNNDEPITLLVFNDAAGCTDFWRRHGQAWNVHIAPPAWGAYTVQDIATAVFDPATGPRRPTFVHEAIHATLAHDVRIMPGTLPHGWMQEGMANYVQLSLHPGSIDAAAYPAAFAAGVGPGSGFVPLKQLVSGPAEGHRYAQLASLFAYLAERRPKLLPIWAKAVVAGTKPEAALEPEKLTIDQLEAEWVAWGRQRFAAPRTDGHFDKPAEWK